MKLTACAIALNGRNGAGFAPDEEMLAWIRSEPTATQVILRAAPANSLAESIGNVERAIRDVFPNLEFTVEACPDCLARDAERLRKKHGAPS